MYSSLSSRLFSLGGYVAEGWRSSFNHVSGAFLVSSDKAGIVRCVHSQAAQRADNPLSKVEYSPQSVRFRMATIDDIDSMNACNRASLPENYTREFFQEYILRWREVCLVAEGANAGIIGYCLGRIEDFTTPGRREMFLSSIAVLPQFRGRKIGESLLQKLHSNMARCYEATHVSLHCRPSNEGALRIYRRMDYCERQLLPGYYEDGEAALLLTKDLASLRGGVRPRARQETSIAPHC